MMQRSPIRAPDWTWEKCQIRVPGPMLTSLSMQLLGWTK
jgi:hypothetical protein